MNFKKYINEALKDALNAIKSAEVDYTYDVNELTYEQIKDRLEETRKFVVYNMKNSNLDIPVNEPDELINNIENLIKRLEEAKDYTKKLNDRWIDVVPR